MKLAFIGDVNFRNFDKITLEKSQELLSGIECELANTDFRIVNLENPLADKAKHMPIQKSGPNHMYSPECVSFLNALKTDVAVLANNHMFDFGEGALSDTIKLLDSNKIKHVGAGANIEEAYKSVRLENVSLIAVCENEFGAADESKWGTAGYNIRRLYNSIRAEKEASDYVIVIFHGGSEFNPLPSPETADRYRMLCDMGADSVIAMHTHCPQGYEIYNGKPIVYSMGNFMFQSGIPREENNSWYYGYVSILDIEKDRNISLHVIPYKFDASAQIKVFCGDEKEKMTEYLEKISAIIGRSDELRKYYMGWCYNHRWFPKVPESYGGLKGRLCPDYNLLSCEAHSEMIKENYRILNDGDEEIAKEYSDKIKVLSVMPV